jgi:hypothetical protein
VRKAILGILATAILAAVCWASGDPWKEKPYTQWDDKDVQKIMSDSPWMRTVIVAADWNKGGGGGYDMPGDNPRPAAPSGGGGGGMGKPGSAGGGGGGGSAPSGGGGYGGDDSGPSIPQAQFSVYWMSSRTMRAALGRRQVLHSGRDAAEVDAFVSKPMDEYEIVLQGRDMNPFVNNDEKFFQANALLEVKKSKDKIAPSRVTLERGADGKTVTGAFFYFPKKSASGENEIAPDEKGVTFSVKLGKTTLKADFDPRKMDDQKGSDL